MPALYTCQVNFKWPDKVVHKPMIPCRNYITKFKFSFRVTFTVTTPTSIHAQGGWATQAILSTFCLRAAEKSSTKTLTAQSSLVRSTLSRWRSFERWRFEKDFYVAAIALTWRSATELMSLLLRRTLAEITLSRDFIQRRRMTATISLHLLRRHRSLWCRVWMSFRWSWRVNASKWLERSFLKILRQQLFPRLKSTR